MDGRWQWTFVAALGLGSIGCGKELIDFVENGPGCSTCEACAHQFGSCRGEGVACKAGFVDLDAGESGCETPLSDVESDWTAGSSWSQSVAIFQINEKEFDMFAWPELVAVDGDLECVASLNNPCSYTIRVLKLAFTDFMFDRVDWLNGSATLTGPFNVTDQGGGLFIERAPLVFGFDYAQEGEKKSAVSSGDVRVVVHYDARLNAGSIHVDLLDTVRFGGYRLEAMTVSARLDAL